MFRACASLGDSSLPEFRVEKIVEWIVFEPSPRSPPSPRCGELNLVFLPHLVLGIMVCSSFFSGLTCASLAILTVPGLKDRRMDCFRTLAALAALTALTVGGGATAHGYDCRVAPTGVHGRRRVVCGEGVRRMVEVEVAVESTSASRRKPVPAAYAQSLFTPTHVSIVPSVAVTVGDGAATAHGATASARKSSALYIVTDCWHHRILSTRNLSSPVNTWRVLLQDVSFPHSTASSVGADAGAGTPQPFYLAVEDMTANAIIVLDVAANGTAVSGEIFPVKGIAPHRVLFSESHNAFWVLSSWPSSVPSEAASPEATDMLHMTKVSVARPQNATHTGGIFSLSYFDLPFLKMYTRSFRVHGSRFFFATSAGIYVADFKPVSLGISETPPTFVLSSPPFLFPGGFLNDVFFSRAGNMFLTWTSKSSEGDLRGPAGGICAVRGVKPETFAEDIAGTSCEALSEALGTQGTPYFLTQDEFTLFGGSGSGGGGRIILPETQESSGILEFSEAGCVDGEIVCHIHRHSKFATTDADLDRKEYFERVF